MSRHRGLGVGLLGVGWNGIRTGSGPGSPDGQPGWGGGSDRPQAQLEIGRTFKLICEPTRHRGGADFTPQKTLRLKNLRGERSFYGKDFVIGLDVDIDFARYCVVVHGKNLYFRLLPICLSTQ